MKKAIELVEGFGVKDAELRKTALCCCFQALFTERDTASRPWHTRKKRAEDKPESPVDESAFWTGLSRKSGLKDTTLKDIFELQGGRVLLGLPRTKIKGESTREKRKWHAALVLYGYREGLEREYVTASDLAAAAKHTNLHDDKHYGTDLSRAGWFKGSGTGASHKYGLSADGLASAKEYMKELAGT